MTKNRKTPTLFLAFIPIVCLICLLALNVILYGEDTLSGSNQIALLFSAFIAGIIAFRLRYTWSEISKGIVKSISTAMPAILILLFIGSLAGTWLISGVIPALIYYGLKVIHPGIFLFAAVIASGMVSLATGSSWSTVATIGVALNGIGQTLGIHPGLVAGAILSGAYFGDKNSPMSDTTNLAPAVAGTDLFTHVRYMFITTFPSLLLTLVIFLIIGFNYHSDTVTANIDNVLRLIDGTFNLTPVLFVVPVLLIIVIIRKVPPIPALFFGTLLGAVFAIIFQPDLVRSVAGNTGNFARDSYLAVMQAMFGTTSIITGDLKVDELLTTSGMAGMLNTIWLILAAMTYGGVMECAGLLMRISQAIIKMARSTGSLVASTVLTCIFFNITAADQYIAIVVPGRMFARTYRDRGYKPELLSRTLEDGGTVTSVLIPWNTCGATQARVLGVSTFTYLPYCFFNLISPLMTIFIASINYRIRRFKPEKER